MSWLDDPSNVYLHRVPPLAKLPFKFNQSISVNEVCLDYLDCLSILGVCSSTFQSNCGQLTSYQRLNLLQQRLKKGFYIFAWWSQSGAWEIWNWGLLGKCQSIALEPATCIRGERSARKLDFECWGTRGAVFRLDILLELFQRFSIARCLFIRE